MKKTLSTLAFLVAVPVALRAQSGNASDVGGNSVTSSMIAGGFVIPKASNAGTTSVPNSSAIAQAVASQSSVIRASLSSGTFTSPTGATISAAAAANVLAVMTGATPEARTAVRSALAQSGASNAVIAELLSNLPSLLTNPTPGQIQAALSSFNGVVQGASTAFLANPPGEFVAIHAVLSQISAAARAAR